MEDKNLYQKLIDEHSKNERFIDLATYLCDEIGKIRTIENKVRSIQKLEREEIQRHENEMKKLKDMLTDIQKICRHLSKTYNGDPSGGTDSFHSCNHCGKHS